MQKAYIGKKLKTYTINRLLGKGAWASVFQVYDEATGEVCACKIIARKLMVQTPKLKELVQTQITVLKRCKSENVIKYVDSFSTEKQVFIITQFCNGGDVQEYLAKKKRLTEDEALQFLKQILNGFKGLHQIGAMHRDFKTANILIHNKVAKIADLGFSKILKDTNITKTILGTSVTMAPQLLENKSYGRQCDVWSVGVVYYQLLIGEYPYNGLSDNEILKKIKAYPPRFPEGIEISSNSKDFIKKCLTVDPKKRISWIQIYEHPLLKVGRPMGVGIGMLMSQINPKDVEEVYKRTIQMKPIGNPDEFKNVELVDSSQALAIEEEVRRKNAIEKTITEYSELYLQRRNIIMLTIKYGITLIYQLQSLPINQNIYTFLISKRAFLEIRDLRSNIRAKRNPFNLKNYFEHFLKSKEYLQITTQVNSDFESISINAEYFMSEVDPNYKGIKKHLSLDTFQAEFNSIYKEELSKYTFMLYDNKDNPRVDKSTLLKLMTFVSDLVKGIMVSYEDYERKMESLNQKQMEANFAKKYQDVINQYRNN